MKQEILNKITDLDYAGEERRITEFIGAQVRSAGVDGCVIGLSGGLDSGVVTVLAKKTMKEKIFVLCMPDSTITPKQDIADAEQLIQRFGIENYQTIDIHPIFSEYYKRLTPNTKSEGNLRARIRMSLLYYFANKSNLLVLGTGDRSELLIGYFTKFGDGGCDILPLAHLYKTQVRALGMHLNLSKNITQKSSTPALWSGHSAEEELGLTYEEIDSILYCMERKLPITKIVKETGMEESKILKVLEMNAKSEHKRKLPANLL